VLGDCILEGPEEENVGRKASNCAGLRWGGWRIMSQDYREALVFTIYLDLAMASLGLCCAQS